MQDITTWDFWRQAFAVACGVLIAGWVYALGWSVGPYRQENPFTAKTRHGFQWLQLSSIALGAAIAFMISLVWAFGW